MRGGHPCIQIFVLHRSVLKAVHLSTGVASSSNCCCAVQPAGTHLMYVHECKEIGKSAKMIHPDALGLKLKCHGYGASLLVPAVANHTGVCSNWLWAADSWQTEGCGPGNRCFCNPPCVRPGKLAPLCSLLLLVN